MAYKIIVSPRTQKEIENAIDYYSLYNSTIPAKFIALIEEAYATLETYLFFRVRYKNIRALKIKDFPYSLYFSVNENENYVKVLSCFHHKLNPNKRPIR
jgi:mRNA-degrading endonuclease RelE of RelBE toxin-antitoxin system